jgi:glucokinase
MSYSLGIDLGGSSVKTVAISLEGETLAQSALNFDAAAKMDWAEKIRSIVEEFQRQQNEPAAHLGLSAPGLAAKDGRSIFHMPGRLQGLEGLDWTSFLKSPRPVPVLNDAHAALLGESWLGAARGFHNVILLTLGTGVGGAAIVDGRLLRGHLGRAGHLGHVSLDIDGPPDVCRMPGSLEVMIGNCTIAQRTNRRFQSTHELVAAHLAGDPDASRVWLRSVRALACAIGSFVNVLDPEVVVIGGGIAQSGEALFAPLRPYLAEVEWRSAGYAVKVLPAALGEFAGAIGAARNAMDAGQIWNGRGATA